MQHRVDDRVVLGDREGAEGAASAPALRLGVLSRQRVVARGLLALLSDLPDGSGSDEGAFEVRPVGWDDAASVDVLLYDAVGLAEDGDRDQLVRLVKETDVAVVAVDRTLRPDLTATALTVGASSFVSMDASGEELLAACRAAVAEPRAGRDDAATTGRLPASSAERLGRTSGLTPAEVEVLRMIAAGRSNEEIARDLFLSVNTIKSRIRSAYRRLGITHRSQAVSWAIKHGLEGDAPGR